MRIEKERLIITKGLRKKGPRTDVQNRMAKKRCTLYERLVRE